MFKLTFKQQVLTGFAVSLLFVLVSAVTSYLSVEKLKEDTQWQSHTYEVINLLKNTEIQVLNSESALRGFILSKKSDYLRPYNKNAPLILETVQDLKRLISDNADQIERADSF